MADDDIRRLQRAAERSGPAAFLLGLVNPDTGGLLRQIAETEPQTFERIKLMIRYAEGRGKVGHRKGAGNRGQVDRRRWTDGHARPGHGEDLDRVGPSRGP